MQPTRRPRALLTAVALVLASGAVACSADSNQDSAARNESNFNTRSIVAFASELPTFPDARSVTRGALEAGAWHRTYEVQAPAADVLAFYQHQLPSAGWTDGGTPKTTPGGAEATWRRRGLRLDVTVAPTAAGSTTTSTASGSTASPSGVAGAASGTSTVNLAMSRVGGS